MTKTSGASRHRRFAFLFLAGALAFASAGPARADTNDAAIVIDTKTGKTLFESNADARRYPASLTKMMTLFLLFESLDKGDLSLASPLTVSAFAAGQAPSKLDLSPGSSISVQNAILAIVTRSANDVAVVIAENLAGSENAFAARMTATAHAIGMTHTTFRNASGLPNPLQSTTARDLSVLARALQDRFPQYYHYFSARDFVWQGERIPNHNGLLGHVDGVDGIKTGYTRASGYNLVTSLHAENRALVAVVMGGATGASRDREMAGLIDRFLPTASAGPRIAPLVGGKGAPIQSTPRAGATLVAAVGPGPRRKPADNLVTASVTPNAMPDAGTAEGDTVDDDALPALRTGRSQPRSQTVAAATPTLATPSPGWKIQIGAMPTTAAAEALLAKARGAAPSLLASATPFTEPVVKGSDTLYRARFSGFADKDAARSACDKLSKMTFNCIAVP